MTRKQYIEQKVIDFYAQNPPVAKQIMHTQSVASFTNIISCGDELLEIAAWLHDIGCPPSREKYGDSKAPHQEAEGKILVHQWLDNSRYFTEDEVNWLSDVVGSHHQLSEARRLDFMPLFEADLIVNLFEGYYPMEDAQKLVDSGAVITPNGKSLFKTLFHCNI